MQNNTDYIRPGDVIAQCEYCIFNSDFEEYTYIIFAETELNNLIHYLDRKGAEKLMNEHLLKIFQQFEYGMDKAMNHSVVWIGMLCRTIIRGKADVKGAKHFQVEYLKDLDCVKNLDELRAQMMDIAEEYIRLMFNYEHLKHSDKILEIMDYIQRYWKEDITLGDIAGSVHFNKSYLSSFFNRETGISISDYINQMKIKESKKLLKHSRLTLVEISMECGFTDQCYFSKVFKKMVGMSPGEYRAKEH